MLVVVALLFPVLLLLGVLGLGAVEHRLQRRLFGTDVKRYLDSHTHTDDAEDAIATQAERLLAAKRWARRQGS